MAQGDLISRANYVNTWGSGWLHNDKIIDDYVQNNGSYHLSYYIAAPEIYVTFGSWHTGPDSTQANMIVYKYNGSSFQQYGRVDINLNISDSSDWRWRYFSHNTGGSTEITDNSDTHLWKIECNWYAGQWIFIPTRCGMYLNIACSGIGSMSSTFDYMWKPGSKLYACPCTYWPTSSYGSDTAFIDANKPEAFTGKPITASNGYMAYSVRE